MAAASTTALSVLSFAPVAFAGPAGSAGERGSEASQVRASEMLFFPGPGSPESWSTTVAKPDVVIPPPPVPFRSAARDFSGSNTPRVASNPAETSSVLIVVVAALTVIIALAGLLAWHAIVTFRSWRAFHSYLGAFLSAAARRARSLGRGLPKTLNAARPRHWPRDLRGAQRSLALGYRRLVRSAASGRRFGRSPNGFGFSSFAGAGQGASSSQGGTRRTRGDRGLDALRGLDDPMLAGGARAVERAHARARHSVSLLSAGSALHDTLESEIETVKRRVGVAFMIAAGEDGSTEAVKRRQGVMLRNAARDLDRIEKIARSAIADPRGAYSLATMATGQDASGRAGSLDMPTTPAEAYLVLGVTASVPERALKKVVDGLRMSWHPDLADDEDDRLLREDRIKQINLAWDLIKARHGHAAVRAGGGASAGAATAPTAA